jgi:hypothetical protein
MRYLVITMLLLSGCGRINSAYYTCSAEQQERLERVVNNCAKESLNNKQSCWATMVKNVCTYKE